MIHSMRAIELKDMEQKQPDGCNVDCCITDMLVHELTQSFMAEYDLSLHGLNDCFIIQVIVRCESISAALHSEASCI